jgi:hypothetical protein
MTPAAGTRIGPYGIVERRAVPTWMRHHPPEVSVEGGSGRGFAVQFCSLEGIERDGS